MTTYNKHDCSKNGNVINNSMSIGLQHNLKDAIKDAGASVPESACLWEYPKIIRENLIAKTVSVLNIKGSDIIKVTKDNDDFVISTEIDKKTIPYPNYANKIENDKEKVSADIVFQDLFTNILPTVRGLYAADITQTNSFGTDVSDWNNTLFNVSGRKTNLKPNSKYLRIYLTCQAEPLFIYIDAIINTTINGYNIESSDSIEFKVDNEKMTISGHVSSIELTDINKLN